MTQTRRAITHDRPAFLNSRALAAVALAASLLGALPAAAQEGMVLNSATTERYRQQALQGKKQHDFSPRTAPRGGRMIYGHWTPYTPPDPATLPAEARKHQIKSGDTMWLIADKYYKDGYLWPYVWEANSWIQYPHWIYPGDVLLLPPIMMLPQGELAEEKPPELPDILAGYYPAAGMASIYCGHYIADPNEKAMGEIIGSESDPQPTLMSKDDFVYVNLGSEDGVLPGDEFAIVYPREHIAINAAELKWQKDDQLMHPISGEPLGVVKKMAGRLKIVLLGEQVSTAQVTYACDSIEAGWELNPFTETPYPLMRRHERERIVMELPKQGRGNVVWMEDMVQSGTIGVLLSIDLGAKDGLIPGDVFQVFRDELSDPYTLDVEHLGAAWDVHNAKRRAKPHREADAKTVYGKQDPIYDVPPRLIGEIVVLYTQDHTATCRFAGGQREVYVGDQVVYEPVDTGLSSVAVIGGGYEAGKPLSQQAKPLPPKPR